LQRVEVFNLILYQEVAIHKMLVL